MSYLIAILVTGGALAALDAGLRRTDVYASTVFDWPAGWRAVPPEPGPASPYRQGAGGAWTLGVGAGIPRATSVFLAPVLGVALLWSLASMLALGDLRDVFHGTRSLPFVLASLSLCVLRALSGWATLGAAYGRRTGAFFVASAVVLGIDAALACAPLPCSDHRGDDVRMALAGCTAQMALAVGLAVSLWRRRGLVQREEPRVAPLECCSGDLADEE